MELEADSFLWHWVGRLRQSEALFGNPHDEVSLPVAKVRGSFGGFRDHKSLSACCVGELGPIVENSPNVRAALGSRCRRQIESTCHSRKSPRHKRRSAVRTAEHLLEGLCKALAVLAPRDVKSQRVKALLGRAFSQHHGSCVAFETL